MSYIGIWVRGVDIAGDIQRTQLLSKENTDKSGKDKKNPANPSIRLRQRPVS